MNKLLSKVKHLSKKLVFLFSALLAVGVGIFIYSYYFSKTASTSWFNEDWLYKQSLRPEGLKQSLRPEGLKQSLRPGNLRKVIL